MANHQKQNNLMKKTLLIFTLFLFFSSVIPVAAESYVCRDGGNGAGWCGERGGCPPGQLCLSSMLETACKTPEEVAAAQRCVNANESTGKKCGDTWTDGNCGITDGGCQTGYKCSVTFGWFHLTEKAECVQDTACGTADTPPVKCQNTSGCGFCADPQSYCQVQEGLATCVKINGQCGYNENLDTSKCGWEVFEDGRYKCKVDGVEANGYVSCAWVKNKCCPTGDMCVDEAGLTRGCGRITTSTLSGPPVQVCEINGQIHPSGYTNCSANASTPDTCCYGIPCPQLKPLKCTEKTQASTQVCECASGLNSIGTGAGYCCGYVAKAQCFATQAEADAANAGGGGTGGPTGEDPDVADPDSFTIFDGPTSDSFKKLNPLAAGGMFGVDARAAAEFSSPGGIITRVLRFAFPIAGLILFVMLVWAGFEILSMASNGKSIQQGSQRATAAIVGFILLFASYFIMQIIEIVFSITIL